MKRKNKYNLVQMKQIKKTEKENYMRFIAPRREFFF